MASTSGTPAAVQAAGAESFVLSIGVNTHIDFQNYGYQNLTATEAAINYLGVKSLRDDPENPNDIGANGWWQQVANATGAKFDAFLAEGSPAQMEGDLTRAEQLAAQGILSAIEGGNEEDDPYAAQNGNSLATAASFQPQVYAAAHSLGLPAINMSFGQGWTAANNWEGDYGTVGNLAPYAAYANAHTYPGGAPESSIQLLITDSHLAAPGRPVMQTEFGYDTNTIDPTTAAKYTLDGLLDSYADGIAKTYIYALYDDGSGAFGLMNANGTPKPAGLAVHDLVSLLSDPNTGSGFAPGTLAYTVSGGDGAERTLLMQKSDGTDWIAIWDEQQALGSTQTVTLTLGAAASAISVYDPLTSTAATETIANSASVQIALPDHPVLVEVTPAGGSAPADPPADPPSGTTTPPADPPPVTTSPPADPPPANDPPPTTTTVSSTPAWQDLSVAVPAAVSATTGQSVAVSGVSISDTWAAAASGTMALNIYDQTGTIEIAGQSFGPGGGKVAGGMITGTEAQLNADLAGLAYVAGSHAGSDTLTVDVWNQAGVETTKTITVAVSAPAYQDLSVATPAKLSATTGQSVAVSGVSISDAWAATAGGMMALNIYDQSGTIEIAGRTFGPGGGKVAGGMITGTEAQLNADLAALTYVAGARAGTDTLTVDVWNQAGVETTQTIAVTVAPPSWQDLAISAPSGGTVVAGAVLPLSGLSIKDAWAAGNPGTMALNIGVQSGTVILGGHSYGPGWSTVTGTEAQLNAELAGAAYQAGGHAGSDAITLVAWNQAGVNVARTIPITVAAPAGAGATAHTVAVPAAQSSYAAIANSTLFVAGAGSHMLFIGGTNDRIVATGGTENISVGNAHNTVIAGAGNDRIAVWGSDNLINAGGGANTITDHGGGNTIVLPAGGSGIDLLNAAVLTNGDLLDLRPILGATGWNRSASSLSHYLSTGLSGGNAVLRMTPSGRAGGTSYNVAQFTGSGAVSLPTVLQHAIL